MILTVTINPLLEKRLSFTKINLKTENRSSSERLAVGGKGINVSRQLKTIGAQTFAYTMLGGNNGKIIRQLLGSEGIEFSASPSKNETRYAVIAQESTKGKPTTFFSPGSIVTKEEAGEFISRLAKTIQNCEIVVLSGSSPCPECDEIFPAAIEYANKYDKISILDTYGPHLGACLEKKPTIIHNNLLELETSLGISLKEEQDILNFLLSLYNRGIKISALTNGGEPAYASNFDFIYKVTVPKVDEADPTGSGDSFVAGLAYGFHNSMVFEEILKFSSALGTLNAVSDDICIVSLDEADKFKNNIEVTPVGKKMKLLDTTPTI
jgi:1-phosphofructokinase family hexose kinase